jgi:hypothetical protein
MTRILRIILLVLLLTGLFFVFRLAQQRQETRKKAETAGLIKFSLQLTNSAGQAVTEALPETPLTAQVLLTNPQDLPFQVAGADLTFNPDVLTISNLTCDPQLPEALPANQIGVGQIKISCYQKTGGVAPASALGSFVLVVKNTAPLGPTTLAFSRTRTPQAGTATDLADNGTPFTLTIIPPPTPTLTTPPVSEPSSAPTQKPVCMINGSPCRQDSSCCSQQCIDGLCTDEPIAQ